ncbi:MAG: LysR family transcriptional regulator [Pseudomonadota bacterium]
MSDDAPLTTLKIRLVFGEAGMFGPGKADLLDGIAETGSISAAGRRLGMSYKRAWQLVETMNTCFADPLVLSTRGGAQGGGAVLTDTGREVLATYRKIAGDAARTAGTDIERLERLLAKRQRD